MALIQTSKGKYGKGTIRQNNLTENALQKPAIYSTMIRLKQQYGFTYLTEGTGRIKLIDTKTEEWGNNSFEWFIKGRSDRPSTVASAITNISGNTFVLPTVENYLNKTEVVKLATGKFAIVTGDCQGNGPFYYPMQMITADDSTGLPYVPVAADAPAGSQVSIYSNLNIEKSERGYSTIGYPDKYIQYMSIHRRGLDISGSACGNVSWITNTKSGQSLWYFESEDEVDKQMLRHMDIWRMYGRNTMKSTGVPMVSLDGKPLFAGDGVLSQIEGINEYQFSSDDDINRKNLSDYIGMLATKAADFDNNHWMVLTGQRGGTIFHQLMENSIINNGNMAINQITNKPIDMGGNYASYRVGTNTITLVRVACFDDEHLHSQRDSNSYLLESSRMVFLNYGHIDNESNVIIAVRKGAGNGNRGLIKKYIAGMVDPFGMKLGAMANNSSDGFECQWLSESGAVITNPFACGQWRRTS